MTIENHIESLNRKHREIEDQLHELMKSPSADDIEIAELKKEKLRLKDEIEGHTSH